MSTNAIRLRGRVRNGHIVTDDAVDWPEGTAVDVLVADIDDDLADDDLAALHGAIAEADAECARGDTVAAHEVVAALKARG